MFFGFFIFHLITEYTEVELSFIEQLKEKYKLLYDSIQPIPYIKDRMYCVDKVFVEGGIEFRTFGENSYSKLESYNDILNRGIFKSNRKIIEGDPGYGKSTLALQMLYDWCIRASTSPLKEVDVLIYIRLRQLKGLNSIYSAIRQFILPKESDLCEDDIKKILQSMDSVLLLMDGYDEYPDQESNETDVSHILRNEMFRKMDVILTTRQSCLPRDYLLTAERIRLTGFDKDSRISYIRKAVAGDNENVVSKILRKLHRNPVLDDLCQVPLLFVMFAHMTAEKRFGVTFNSVTSFFVT